MIKEFVDGNKKVSVEIRNGFALISQYSLGYGGKWMKQGHIFVPEKLRHLTSLALDGGDSAASEQFPTPEVLSTLQGESTPAHRR
jgi:hypothetical protein